ncbi:PLD-like domain-containing protein [Mucilaginibacter gossypiicola]|uniref:PLD-like domain-containing protein n=1 Tax=Mucilaginibacter gossypiicola TaxID=551995 RepID=A0A1H8M657_9SPHI|nr:phospholipase D-like domain-containing protein [Mucilaginibacter gossypiicola]SEO12678.1 PLD-like domain-containing protein [Mucilaginibacter gossypiicola]
MAYPAALLSDVPEPFKSESAGGSGIHMHHKFVVIDFDLPTARVYTGSYNFSIAADEDNGENLWCFDDRRIAVAYMIQAVTMFDHYEWRDAHAKVPGGKLYLKTPPAPGGATWFDEDFSDPQKIKDRVLFS